MARLPPETVGGSECVCLVSFPARDPGIAQRPGSVRRRRHQCQCGLQADHSPSWIQREAYLGSRSWLLLRDNKMRMLPALKQRETSLRTTHVEKSGSQETNAGYDGIEQ